MIELIMQGLGILVIIVALFVIYNQHNMIEDLISKKQSLSTKYGKMTEHFFPFLESYPYNKNNFRFIGSPIDGIQFEDDKIVLVEFKTASSHLTSKQRRVRELVKGKKVIFKEFRVDDKEFKA